MCRLLIVSILTLILLSTLVVTSCSRLHNLIVFMLIIRFASCYVISNIISIRTTIHLLVLLIMLSLRARVVAVLRLLNILTHLLIGALLSLITGTLPRLIATLAALLHLLPRRHSTLVLHFLRLGLLIAVRVAHGSSGTLTKPVRRTHIRWHTLRDWLLLWHRHR